MVLQSPHSTVHSSPPPMRRLPARRLSGRVSWTLLQWQVSCTTVSGKTVDSGAVPKIAHTGIHFQSVACGVCFFGASEAPTSEPGTLLEPPPTLTHFTNFTTTINFVRLQACLHQCITPRSPSGPRSTRAPCSAGMAGHLARGDRQFRGFCFHVASVSAVTAADGCREERVEKVTHSSQDRVSMLL